MVLHNVIILKKFVTLLFILFYLENLRFFSDICGCSTIFPFPTTTPKNSIVVWKICIVSLLIMITCSSNFSCQEKMRILIPNFPNRDCFTIIIRLNNMQIGMIRGW